ncbi:hypothetical protein SAMN05444370_14110 [Rubrimonas cliftonensis]|uniref:Uncharacterized protein n=1 Tax=Rubrimonas cliftonensis TaxID=89524 RepID=A0A1H4G9A5_9RHOB|nr:hypothetical protein SAMN05444370_14110 [Rubrimonas cliftonensis]
MRSRLACLRSYALEADQFIVQQHASANLLVQSM